MWSIKSAIPKGPKLGIMNLLPMNHFFFVRWICLCVLLTTFGCSKREHGQAPLRKITIGIQVSPAMTLVMVAKDKGFFRNEGLNVELKEFTAGKFALQAFLARSIDFAVSGEVPVCLATLQQNDIRVITQVVESTTNEVRVVALKDASTTSPADYFKMKKRKLATSFGGGPEFYTYNFIKRNNIAKEQVEILSQTPADMPAALESRSVDAISIFDPFAFIAEKRMTGKVVTFSDPRLYSELYVLDARPEQTEKMPEVCEALVRALVKSAEFIDKDPETAKQVMQNYTKLDRDVIEGIWGNFAFRPALNQKLVDYWNAQAIWAKETAKVTPDTKVPNFRDVIEARFLKGIRPDAVKLD
jgi:ABC-type nitrate/sulfonate/bicarbonate transport system substrate-binding protein